MTNPETPAPPLKERARELDDVTCGSCHGFSKMHPDYERMAYICGECQAINTGVPFFVPMIRGLKVIVEYERECYGQLVSDVAEAAGLEGEDLEDAENHPNEVLLPAVADLLTKKIIGESALAAANARVAELEKEVLRLRILEALSELGSEIDPSNVAALPSPTEEPGK